MSSALVRAAGAGWLVYGLPHMMIYLAHLALLPSVGRVLNVFSLTIIPLAAAMLLRWKPRVGETREPAGLADSRRAPDPNRRNADPNARLNLIR